MISNRIRPGDVIADVVDGEAMQRRNLELLLNEMADQIDALTVQQRANTQAVSDMDARVTQNESDISTAQADIVSMQAEIDDHETRISDLESP